MNKPLTVHLSKAIANSTLARIYKDQHVFEVVLPEFVILKSDGFDLDEQRNILCKLGKMKENLLIMAQRNCSVDL